MRYNEQLGLSTEFLTKDITAPDFIEELLERIQTSFGSSSIDVLTGGPPCQSFSLAGERRKNDKKDDLFSYYLKVIEVIRPKYFVMENVYGILTKDNGKVKERILKEIRNIVDYEHLQQFVEMCEDASKHNDEIALALRILKIWISQDRAEKQRREDYLAVRRAIKSLKVSPEQETFLQKAILDSKNDLPNSELSALCTELANAFVDAYRNNKQISEDDRNVIRQALSLIAIQNALERTSKLVKYEINAAELKRSEYKDNFDSITDHLDLSEVFNLAFRQCDFLLTATESKKAVKVVEKIRLALEILEEGAFETMQRVLSFPPFIRQLSAKGVF